MYLQKVISKKTLKKKLIFVGILRQPLEKKQDPDPDPNQDPTPDS
jgi:hypothetical protein